MECFRCFGFGIISWGPTGMKCLQEDFGSVTGWTATGLNMLLRPFVWCWLLDGRVYQWTGTGRNSFKVTLWFNGAAYFKACCPPSGLVHLCHKHLQWVPPLATEAPVEAVKDVNHWQMKHPNCRAEWLYLPGSFYIRMEKESAPCVHAVMCDCRKSFWCTTCSVEV